MVAVVEVGFTVVFLVAIDLGRADGEREDEEAYRGQDGRRHWLE